VKKTLSLEEFKREQQAYDNLTIADSAFKRVILMASKMIGITIDQRHRPIVVTKLLQRLRHYKLQCFDEYFDLIESGVEPAERQIFIDLLTTNETYFFREPKQFEIFKNQLLPELRLLNKHIRLWSAACSEGAEAYTLAMVLARYGGLMPWDIFASDISERVLNRAKEGVYCLSRVKNIPDELLQGYCIAVPEDDLISVSPNLKSKVRFDQVNLNETLPNIGQFNVIFLRNVLIYFSKEQQNTIITRVLGKLKTDGYLFLSMTESLDFKKHGLKNLSNSIYQKIP